MIDKVADPVKEEEFNAAKRTIDDYMFEEMSKMYTLAFEQQFHFGVYYAYMKLKEQEIRNIGYLGELIQMNVARNKDSWKKIVIPFKDVY